MKKNYLIILTLLLSQISMAQKSAVEKDSTVKTRTLDEVIVTSSRLQISKQQLPHKVDVITAKDIEMNPSLDVGEIIKKMGALDVIQRPGVATYATIRGFRPPVEPGKLNPEATVLINGRPSGTQNLALIDASSVERIEILKGAAGAIYGSSAMGGIINIITKKTKGTIKGQVFGGYGSFETNEAGFAIGGNITNKLDFNVSSTFLNRNGDLRFGSGNIFRKLLKSEEVELFPTTGTLANKTVIEADTAFDGRERNSTKMTTSAHNIRVGYQINENWRADVSGNFFIGRNIESSGDLRNLDAQQGFANRFYQTIDFTLSGRIKNHNLTFLGYNMKEENSTFNNFNGTTVIIPAPTYQRSEGIVEWRGVQVQDVFNIKECIKVIMGADFNEATSKSRGFAQALAAQNFAVTERSPSTPFSTVKTFAPFAQAHISMFKDKFILNPSIRYDFIDFEILPTNLFLNLTPKKESNRFLSPSLAMQYNVTNSWAVHTNLGRAFRFAQAFEVAGYFEEYLAGNKVRISTGNPDVKNEQSVTGDIGIKYNNFKKGIRFDITYFSTSVDDRIRQEPVASRVGQTHTDGRIIDRFLTFTNADKAVIQGLEIDGSYDFGLANQKKYGLSVFANVTHLIQAVDITNGRGIVPDVEVRIRNVAPLNIGYGIEYDNKNNFSVRLSGRYLSKRYGQDFSNLNPNLRGAFMEFPSYMTLDLNVNYSLAKQHIISLRVANLTDENYYETRGFNLAGRSTGLRYTYKF